MKHPVWFNYINGVGLGVYVQVVQVLEDLRVLQVEEVQMVVQELLVLQVYRFSLSIDALPDKPDVRVHVHYSATTVN